MPRCDACPVADGPCYGPCQWAADPVLRPRVVRRAGMPAPVPAGVPAGVPGHAAFGPHEPFTRSWSDRVNTCLYRTCNTGCVRSVCHAGRGDEAGDVSVLDCRDCLRGLREPQREVTPCPS